MKKGLANKKRSSEMPMGGMITTPGSSAYIHTGNWRSKRAVIDDSKCINCLFCVQYCPEYCIAQNKDGKRGKVDYEYCKGCGICAQECPVKCIEMVPESEFEEEKCEDECVLNEKKFKI